ncbi:MAG: ADP-ribosylglycohydrolase family protein [Mesorhizobium sp.]|nr:ADP-ribosylglycohydrolase family protein [Mesorhizobium sp.]MBN9245527.1 ADP-ribosylglycohydrolase family protein [Mesorhizobium sp.]
MSSTEPSPLEKHALACLAFGVIGDAMGSATELQEPEEIERRFGWVDSFEGDGTDDVIMRDLLAEALMETGGNANADDWAAQWLKHRDRIFGEKSNRFFASITHAAEKLARGYSSRTLATGTMPSSTSAMSIAPVGIVNAGNARAAAAQAVNLASLVHVTGNSFCQDAAAAVAAAIATALSPGATVDSVLAAAVDAIGPWGGEEMRSLISDALELAKASKDFKEFRKAYHARFRRAVICDSRETVPATLAIVWLAAGDPWQAVVLSANFGRDTDTIGCMAGSICGALAGLDDDNAAKIARLSPPVLADQHRLAGELVSLHRRKARAETTA